jgi:hypothetical protein
MQTKIRKEECLRTQWNLLHMDEMNGEWMLYNNIDPVDVEEDNT